MLKAQLEQKRQVNKCRNHFLFQNFDPSLKKKKKKKKTPFDLEGALNDGAADEAQDSRETPEPGKEDEDLDLDSFGKKKKKKKKPVDDEEEKGDDEKEEGELLQFLTCFNL